MKKYFHILFISIVIFMMLSCASSPANQSSNATMSIQTTETHHAVSQLTTPSQPEPTPRVTIPELVAQAVESAFRDINKTSRIALVNFATGNAEISEALLGVLEHTLVEQRFIVVDRSELDRIRVEQAFQLDWEVDDNTAVNIGRFVGAEVIVTGSVDALRQLRIRVLNTETAIVSGTALLPLPSHITIEPATHSAQRTTQTIGRTTVQTDAISSVQYTITFNANGASGIVPSTLTVQNGESITIPGIGAMINSRRTFGGWNTRSDGNGTTYAEGSTFIVNANTQLFAIWVEQVYRIGDRGPAGGWVFYDKGNFSGGWRYLEVAPANTERSLPFFVAGYGMYNDVIAGDRRIGSGKENTRIWMREINREGGGINTAQWYCDQLIVNGLDDWYLPTTDELLHMYNFFNNTELGDFQLRDYWSSNDFKDLYYYQLFVNFSNGSVGRNFFNKEARAFVRAIRQF